MFCDPCDFSPWDYGWKLAFGYNPACLHACIPCLFINMHCPNQINKYKLNPNHVTR